MLEKILLEKYDVEVPRYTSYPTVPYWQSEQISHNEWKQYLEESKSMYFQDGLSLYIHLPFCESLCTFCACNKHITKNHLVEKPYIDAVLREWGMYREIFNDKLKIKELHIGGGTPTFFSPENIEYLLREILGEGLLSHEAVLSFEAHPHSTTKEHLEVFKNLGFTRLSLGVQDISEHVNIIINRKQTVAEITEITHYARHLGYSSINFDLIYGLPMQGDKEMWANLDLIKELMPDRIALYSFAFVPWVKKTGQRKFSEHDLPDKVTKRGLYELGKQRLLELGYVEIGMDHFAQPHDSLAMALKQGKLHRNFMGYTHAYYRLLIGLGASAISDIWQAFMQNIPDIKSYQKLVMQGMFPIHRGHRLSGKDLEVRAHILNIMCRLESDFSNSKELWEQIIGRLEPMQKDGLWELVGNNYLRVTERGKPFLRNICQALDLRYWQAKPINPLFSKSI